MQISALSPAYRRQPSLVLHSIHLSPNNIILIRLTITKMRRDRTKVNDTTITTGEIKALAVLAARQRPWNKTCGEDSDGVEGDETSLWSLPKPPNDRAMKDEGSPSSSSPTTPRRAKGEQRPNSPSTPETDSCSASSDSPSSDFGSANSFSTSRADSSASSITTSYSEADWLIGAQRMRSGHHQAQEIYMACRQVQRTYKSPKKAADMHQFPSLVQ